MLDFVLNNKWFYLSTYVRRYCNQVDKEKQISQKQFLYCIEKCSLVTCINGMAVKKCKFFFGNIFLGAKLIYKLLDSILKSSRLGWVLLKFSHIATRCQINTNTNHVLCLFRLSLSMKFFHLEMTVNHAIAEKYLRKYEVKKLKFAEFVCGLSNSRVYSRYSSRSTYLMP